MQVLNTREVRSFKTLAQMTQPKLLNTVYNALLRMYPEGQVTKSKDAVIARGTIPIGLVAHLDTVFKTPPSEIYYDKEANVMWSPDGLGADDRAGVFSILKILSEGYRPHVIFTTDEEMGAIGATNLTMLPCPFEEIKYLIELDRANAIDCVFYDCMDDKFEKYVESFGFVTAIGSFSDIVELCPAWDVCGVNLSIGYRDEHTKSEVLFVGQMLATIEKVQKMLKDADNVDHFPFISRYENYSTVCQMCGRPGNTYMMIPVYVDNAGHYIWMCNECLTDHNVEWCDCCYNGYLAHLLNEDNICEKCEDKLIQRLKINNEMSKQVQNNSRSVQSSDRVQSGVQSEYGETV